MKLTIRQWQSRNFLVFKYELICPLGHWNVFHQIRGCKMWASQQRSLFIFTLHWLEAARRRNWFYRYLWLECTLTQTVRLLPFSFVNILKKILMAVEYKRWDEDKSVGSPYVMVPYIGFVCLLVSAIGDLYKILHKTCSVASTAVLWEIPLAGLYCILNIQIFLQGNIKSHAIQTVADERVFARFDTGGFS
jgi:hypothetical protein